MIFPGGKSEKVLVRGIMDYEVTWGDYSATFNIVGGSNVIKFSLRHSPWGTVSRGEEFTINIPYWKFKQFIQIALKIIDAIDKLVEEESK